MKDLKVCTQCGKPLGSESHDGFCLGCLLAPGLERTGTAQEDSPRPSPLEVRRSGARVTCPHCCNWMQLPENRSWSDIRCDACGSSFSLIDLDAISQEAADWEAVGHFEILERLGSGSFGTVWKAWDTRLDRLVALKIPRKRHLDPREAEQFLREARASAQLQHPNIVSVHEVGRNGDQIYIVSDLIHGVPLSEWLTTHRTGPAEAARLCAKIAGALQHAHEAGVVHRDLKPQNILLDAAGEPYITDFGLARREVGEATMTLDGHLLGTPAYMSPEQARGEGHRADGRADVYSLGVILFQLLTGELPFRGSLRMLLHQAIHEEAPSPRKLNSHIPRDMETICLRCVEKQPRRRFASAAELKDELERFLRGEPIRARPVGQLERIARWCRRQPRLAGAVAASALLLVGVAAVSSVAVVRIAAAREAERRVSYHDSIGLADFNIRNGSIDRAVEILTNCPPDYRNWEWGRLMYLCHQEMLSIAAHTEIQFDEADWEFRDIDLVQSVAFDATGDRIATLGADGALKIWSAVHGTILFAFTNEADRVVAYAFSPNRPTVVIGFAAGGIEVFSTERAATVRRLAGTVDPPKQITFDPGGTRIAAVTASGNIAVWGPEGGPNLWMLRSDGGGVERINFSPDGARLIVVLKQVQMAQTALILDSESGRELSRIRGPPGLSGRMFPDPRGERWVYVGNDGRITLWDTDNQGRPLATVRGSQPTALQQVFFSRDGSTFCTGGEHSTARLWDARTGEELLAFPDRVSGAEFSRDGQWLVTFSQDRAVQVWNLNRKEREKVLLGHGGIIRAVSLDDVSRRIVTGDGNGVVKVWSLGLGREVMRGASWPWGVKPSPDRRQIFAAEPANRQFFIYDAGSGTLSLRVKTGVHQIIDAAWSPDSRRVVTLGKDKIARMWDASTGQHLFAMVGHTRIARTVDYSPNGRWVATGSWDGVARIWDPSSGALKMSLDVGSLAVNQVRFSPQGDQLAVGADAGISLWDLAGNRRLWTNDAPTKELNFHPDGRVVVSRSVNEVIRVWDALTGAERPGWKSRSMPRGLAFSPDGERVAMGSSQGWGYGGDPGWGELWDPVTGRRLLILAGHTQNINEIAFCGGQRIVSGSFDFDVRQWETFPWREEEYPGHGGLDERVRSYADDYWRQRYAAELVPRAGTPVRTVDFSKDRSSWPQRDPLAGTQCIDLTSQYEGLLTAVFDPCFLTAAVDDDLASLPQGLASFGGVAFDVRGVIQLRPFEGRGGPFRRAWECWPEVVNGIRVGQTFHRLHILHGTKGGESDGAVIARLVWHYTNGEQHRFDIAYGRDLRAWRYRPEDVDGTQTGQPKPVWTGSNPVAEREGFALRLYVTTWNNPCPDLEVESLDYVSTLSASAPFLIAVTVEGGADSPSKRQPGI